MIQIIGPGPADRTISEIRVIDEGSVDRVISEIRIIDQNGVDRVVYPDGPPPGTLSLSIEPPNVDGFSFASTVTTNPATATPTGGTGPYTYSWTIVAYTSASAPPNINAGLSATTTFTQSGVSPAMPETATFRCTVTDSVAATASADCDAIFVSAY